MLVFQRLCSCFLFAGVRALEISKTGFYSSLHVTECIGYYNFDVNSTLIGSSDCNLKKFPFTSTIHYVSYYKSGTCTYIIELTLWPSLSSWLYICLYRSLAYHLLVMSLHLTFGEKDCSLKLYIIRPNKKNMHV